MQLFDSPLLPGAGCAGGKCVICAVGPEKQPRKRRLGKLLLQTGRAILDLSVIGPAGVHPINDSPRQVQKTRHFCNNSFLLQTGPYK